MSRYRGVAPLMIGSLVLAGCSGPTPAGREPVAPAIAFDQPTDPDLRQALLQMEAEDQAIREELLEIGYANLGAEDMARQYAVDEANLTELQTIIAEHGWPRAEQVR